MFNHNNFPDLIPTIFKRVQFSWFAHNFLNNAQQAKTLSISRSALSMMIVYSRLFNIENTPITQTDDINIINLNSYSHPDETLILH